MPLLIATSKAADELSIAFVTRGIEDLNLRTCLVNIQMRVVDWLALFLFAALLISEFIWKVTAQRLNFGMYPLPIWAVRKAV